MSKILIVEDEESIAELEKDYLELSGFEVEIENDGTEMRNECYEFTWVGKKASIVFEIFKLYMSEDASDISKRVRVI